MDEMTEKTAAVVPRTKRKKPVFASICLMLCAVCALIEVICMKGGGNTVACAGMMVVFLALSILVLFDRKILSAVLAFIGAFLAAGGISGGVLYAAQRYFESFIHHYRYYFDLGIFFTSFFIVALFGVLLLMARSKGGRQGLAACAGPITLMMLVPIGICIYGEMDTLLGLLTYSATDVLSVVLSVLRLLFLALYLLAINRFCATADQNERVFPKEELTKTNAQVKRPILASVFWLLYGAGTLLSGLLSAVYALLSAIDTYQHHQHLSSGETYFGVQRWELMVSMICDLLIGALFLPVALAILLIVIALLRKKCGKMMAASGLLLIVSEVLVIVLNLLNMVVFKDYHNPGIYNGVWDVLLRADFQLWSMWFSCLPHIALGVFLVACASKKAREGFRKIWIFPFALVAAVFASTSLLTVLAIVRDSYATIILLVVRVLFSGVPMIVALFFTLWWLKDPYKKEQPAAAPAETTARVVVQAAPADKSERGEQLRNSLAEYKALYEAGLITEAEFTEKKRQLLGL